jgi:hypothetical protein
MALPTSFRQSVTLTKGSEERKLAKLAQTSSVSLVVAAQTAAFGSQSA